jgi:hypothetical protein
VSRSGDSILDVNGVIQVRGDATNNNALVQFGGSTYRQALMFSSVGTDVGYLGVAIAANGTDSSSTEVARFTANGLTFNGDTAAKMLCQIMSKALLLRLLLLLLREHYFGWNLYYLDLYQNRSASNQWSLCNLRTSPFGVIVLQLAIH